MAKADLCRCPCLHWVPGTQTTRWKCVWGKFDEEWSQEEMRKAGLGREVDLGILQQDGPSQGS